MHLNNQVIFSIVIKIILIIIVDHAGISIVLMLTSGGLKAVCMQDTTNVLLRLRDSIRPAIYK